MAKQAGQCANSSPVQKSIDGLVYEMGQGHLTLPLPALHQQSLDLLLQGAADLVAVTPSAGVVQSRNIVQFQEPRNEGVFVVDAHASAQREQFDEG